MRSTPVTLPGRTAGVLRRLATHAGHLALALVAGCGAAPLTPPDRPVPPGEPRAAVRLAVDLDRASDCEEAFDLAVYRDRRVDLVTWEPGAGRCDARVVTIRWLSARASKDEVVRLAAAAARKVTELPAAPGGPP